MSANRAAFQRLPQLVQGFFLNYLLQQRQVSPATLASYRDALRLFLRFVQARTRRPPHAQRLQDWQVPLVLKFLEHLECQRHNSPRTRNARLAALRTFMRFVSQQAPEHLQLASRILALPSKRYHRRLLGYLSVRELQAVLRAPTARTWSGRRDQLLFTLLYETGLRVSELLALNQQSVSPRRPFVIQIMGKGRKARHLPLSPAISRPLAQWLAAQPRAPEAPLFTNRFGQRLTRFGVLKRLRQAVTVAARSCPSLRQRQVSPHTFRHTTAMHLLQAGIELPQIALWLGHAQVATTHQYLELDLQMKKHCLQRLPRLGRRACPVRLRDPLLRFLESL